MKNLIIVLITIIVHRAISYYYGIDYNLIKEPFSFYFLLRDVSLFLAVYLFILFLYKTLVWMKSKFLVQPSRE